MQKKGTAGKRDRRKWTEAGRGGGGSKKGGAACSKRGTTGIGRQEKKRGPKGKRAIGKRRTA